MRWSLFEEYCRYRSDLTNYLTADQSGHENMFTNGWLCLFLYLLLSLCIWLGSFKPKTKKRQPPARKNPWQETVLGARLGAWTALWRFTHFATFNDWAVLINKMRWWTCINSYIPQQRRIAPITIPTVAFSTKPSMLHHQASDFELGWVPAKRPTIRNEAPPGSFRLVGVFGPRWSTALILNQEEIGHISTWKPCFEKWMGTCHVAFWKMARWFWSLARKGPHLWPWSSRKHEKKKQIWDCVFRSSGLKETVPPYMNS